MLFIDCKFINLRLLKFQNIPIQSVKNLNKYSENTNLLRPYRSPIVRIIDNDYRNQYKWRKVPLADKFLNTNNSKNLNLKEEVRKVTELKKPLKRLDTDKKYILPINYQIPISKVITPEKQIAQIIENPELYRFRILKQAEKLQKPNLESAKIIQPIKKSFKIVKNTNEIKTSTPLIQKLPKTRMEVINFPKDNIYEHHFFNEKNQKTKIEIYENKKGLIQQHFFNDQGNKTKIEFYNNQGIIIEKQFFNDQGNKTKTEFYSDEGKIIQQHFFNDQGNKTKIEIYENKKGLIQQHFFNDQGNKTKIEFYNNQGIIIEKQFFNDQGNKTKIEIYSNEGKLKTIQDFENKKIIHYNFLFHQKTIPAVELPMTEDGNINPSKLTKEQKKYFQSIRHEGLNFLTNAINSNGVQEITVNAITNLAQDLQLVLQARNPNFEFLILKPNLDLKKIVEKNLEKNKVYLVPFIIPGHQIFALVKNNEIQILDNGGMQDIKHKNDVENLESYLKSENFSVNYKRIPHQSTLPINDFGSCVTFVEALMLEITKMATGITYKHFANPEASFKTPKIEANMSSDTLANFIKDYCARKDHGKGMDIFKIVANYNLWKEQKNLTLNPENQTVVASRDKNKDLLMGVNVNLENLKKLPNSTKNIITKNLKDQNQEDKNEQYKILPIHRKAGKV